MNIKALPERLPATQFWGLAVIVYMVMQFPIIRVPVMFVSTWAHEFGHGLGAIMTGGTFYDLTVFPNFSGVAMTGTVNDFQRLMVIVVGLLGPSLLGVFMIFLTRALHWPRVAVGALAALFLLTQIWAADLFTRAALAGGFIVLAGVTWKAPNTAIVYIANIIALALALNALTGFGYFFIGNAEVAGGLYRSDTGIMADILPGPYWFWGGVMVVLSVLILALGVFFSDRWARKHDRPATSEA